MLEQGGTAERAFNAVDGTIDNMTTTVVFSSCKPNPCREIAKEQWQTGYNFIYLCGRDLKPLNYEVVSARRVFRHAGMDVTLNTTFMPEARSPGAHPQRRLTAPGSVRVS
jgi:hypothetical protein